jgi:hypothetical protein
MMGAAQVAFKARRDVRGVFLMVGVGAQHCSVAGIPDRGVSSTGRFKGPLASTSWGYGEDGEPRSHRPAFAFVLQAGGRERADVQPLG